MNSLDWSVVGVYLTAMIGLSWYLGRNQSDAKDYYLGGNNLSWWSVGISTMATQCSTNSLLGAPAFVITTGLIWLQYEFALPLAMVFIMICLLPFYRKLNLVSVYAYQERRFGRTARTVLSVTFQFLRAFATGVTVYGISIVLQSIVGIPFWLSVVILGVVTVIYDMLGGMAAVVLSDVIQMVILYLGIALCVIYSISEVGGLSEVFTEFVKLGPMIQSDSFVGLQAIDFDGWGFTAETQYGFWPMLFGSLFLYVSYYGTDQTQVQRELSSANIDDTNRSLMLNGMMRFPLVLTYCFLGVCIGAYIVKNPDFLGMLNDGSGPNYNLAVPKFVTTVLPNGIIGLVIVALFSAAMSSLDSTINSLSATTIKDIYEPFIQKGEIPDDKQLKLSRFFTVFWGALIVAFSFFVGDISNSVIESVNKVGSLANGPILAMFLLGILTTIGNERGAVTGLIVGLISNAVLWKFAPHISWLWWNVSGFFVAFGVGVVVSTFTGGSDKELTGLVWFKGVDKEFNYEVNWPARYRLMAGYSVLMILFCTGLTFLL
ncbi:MAG: sodium:solute symporter [Myxococcota bacterium]|nr:sodium:solute symporter [Myxococcota bacterium]